MKHLRLLPFLLAFFFVTVPMTIVVVHAQSSVSGDEVCGAWDPSAIVRDKDGKEVGRGAVVNPCDITDLGKIVKNVLTLVISLGLPLLFVFVAYRFVMAWFSLQQGNANAYKEALKKAGNAILGFFILVALFSGLLIVMLKYLGVTNSILTPLKFLGDAFITHAYAQAQPQYLPNPLGVNSLYDFILSVLRLFMRFFIYPALIAIWVWTGFSFVAAQGAPEALTKAKKWLMWAFITTIVIFMLQTFLVALRGTVQKILSKDIETSQVVVVI